jgi:hypothetical protein
MLLTDTKVKDCIDPPLLDYEKRWRRLCYE